MNPFIYPGLKPPVSNYFIIPGFENRLKPKPHSVKIIYNTVQAYFNGKDHQFTSRKNELVQIRQWTMFLAVCSGLRTNIASGYFQKDHSTAVFACKKIMGEILIYAKPRKDFEYFYRIFRFNPDNIQSTTIKLFLTSWKNRQLTKQMNQDLPEQKYWMNFER